MAGRDEIGAGMAMAGMLRGDSLSVGLFAARAKDYHRTDKSYYTAGNSGARVNSTTYKGDSEGKKETTGGKEKAGQIARRIAIALAAACVAALGGCSQVGMTLQQDAAQATMVAQQVGDTSVVPCFQGLGNVGSAVAGAPKLGILTGLEEKRAFGIALQNPACTGIWLELLTQALKATPAAPFLP